ncbi:MFS transporter [Mycolicibacterium sp.]|uniref:MFS transporter n=1 Tax=Mycolicibacterium sp. TaxID=2320850 RepID=UPI003D138B38
MAELVESATSRPSTPPKKNRSMERRAGIAASMGTLLEYFDFAIFGLLSAIVFPVLFFQDLDGPAALLASFATFGVGFLARPLGALIFAVIGDRFGRRRALNGTLWLMGISSVLVGLLPSQASIGVAAPLILVVLRFGQGIAAGGEICGAQLLALEHAPKERRGRAGSFVAVASPTAQLVANLGLAGLTAVMSDEDFLSWGWRLPLVAAFILLAVAGWVRSRVAETPEFEAAQLKSEDRPSTFHVFRAHPKTAVLLLFSWAGPHAVFPMVTVFGISYMGSEAGFARSTTLSIMVFAQLVAIGGALAGGRVTDRLGARNTMLVAMVSLGLFFVPLFPLVSTGSVVVIAVFMAGSVASVIFGQAAQASFFADAFPVRLRYMGSAMSYAVSGVIFGGTAPFAAAGLLQLSGGNIFAVTGYGFAVVVASFVAVLARPAHPELAPEVSETT